MLITRRKFLGVAGSALLGMTGIALTGCGESRGSSGQSDEQKPAESAESAANEGTSSSDTPSDKPSDEGTQAAKAGAVVVYFSHAGENYGVGVVEEGNTAVLAKMVAEKTGADLFEIVPSKDYPQGYDECCDVALDEQHENARPSYKGDVGLEGYNTVYLGYPIWWGDLPMCVYTFIEAHDWKGKEVRPFCTHAGSGLSGTVEALESACKGATVGKGFSLEGTTAQKSRDEAREKIEAWIG